MKRQLTAWLLILTVVADAQSEEPPTPEIVLNLRGMLTDPAAIDYEGLPRLIGQHAVVCPKTDDLKFQLHNYLIHHGGKYWCLFSHGPVVEDVPTQFVSYTTSDDGLAWSPAKPVMPQPAAPYAYIARGFWLRDGELLALVAHFRDKGAFGVNKELKLQAYVWDAAANTWKFKTTLYEDAINNFAPQKLATGEWLMTRRDARFNVYMLAGGIKSLEDWQSFPVVKRLEIPKFSPDEPFWWQLPDGRLHALFRDNGGSSRLYQAFSSDAGRTWTRPKITNFPNASSKCYPLRLSSGAWAMISNANPQRGRREMYLSLSSDGLTFTQMARLAIPSAKATTFQYPHAIEHDGHLLVAFSQKKEQTEVLKVPMTEIEKLRE
ncbi:MAG: exo-alpha-sialidase [Pirellulaceae bacterium]|nr:exo-alpha-sialidase [Pirellulaceae bacterium]